MNTTATQPALCEGFRPSRDFDGSHIDVPCGDTATRRLLYNNEQLSSYIESQGGWDAYRTDCLAWSNGEEDPGENPGRASWGHETLMLCARCTDELREELATGVAVGISLLSDQELSA